LSEAVAIMGRASLSLIAATLGVLFIANLILGLRWHLILSAASASPGPAILLKIVLVGFFFNQVLPTGVGGDAVRAWRCCKLGIGLGTAIRSILLDRACGYVVIVAVYTAALPTLLHVLPEARERAGVVVVLVAAIVGLLGLVSIDLLPRLLLRLPLISSLAELSRESRTLFIHPQRCSPVLGLSVLSIGLSVVAFKLIADAIGSSLSLGLWAMVVPPVALIQLLPVSLAGWGVREAALVVALGSFGVPPEVALATSILVGLCTIVVGLPGGLIWLTDWDVSHPRGEMPAKSLLCQRWHWANFRRP
jgi:glycosyltransferase 2 family protein